ncbi:protein GET4 [Cyberlindnera jadinii NRRL Y-1542]|uniref:DUF410-domain-containing protein n=1 Tax=Cyberlindnera jadinii (strain ATCC 18201 / CBS 1600 / BCRC 20928 / JCM 3617 / NBRC 0987 / NRRL Y-1542) TaxID=983966 RepID=A0A1E4S248_CYBJN|nr:DUF410-domain-containing protein [Cyberlindnera jadinii NRRL Y-1542]ODV73569.1 DUF410-domain-containing protein [Cyberlindnera jadinii NRRL Y-1542]
MATEINVSNPKLKRTLLRFQAKIAEGDYYEAHQTLRTIANRNVRSKSYGDAIDLLYHGAQILLQSSQPATGSDLTSYLIDVYNESDTKVTTESKARLIQLISLFDPQEPSLKHVGVEAVNWSINHGECQYGDGDIHNALGQKFVECDSLAYEAERHLVLGNSHSLDTYVKHIWSWYQQDSEKSNIGLYVSRCVLNYLFIQNVKNANQALDELLTLFTTEYPSFKYEQITESSVSVKLFDSLPLLNFVQFLLRVVSTGDPKLFNVLVGRYSPTLDSCELKDAVAYIGQLYFGIQVPKQVNLLQNLMSGFLGGR